MRFSKPLPLPIKVFDKEQEMYEDLGISLNTDVDSFLEETRYMWSVDETGPDRDNEDISWFISGNREYMVGMTLKQLNQTILNHLHEDA